MNKIETTSDSAKPGSVNGGSCIGEEGKRASLSQDELLEKLGVIDGKADEDRGAKRVEQGKCGNSRRKELPTSEGLVSLPAKRNREGGESADKESPTTSSSGMHMSRTRNQDMDSDQPQNKEREVKDEVPNCLVNKRESAATTIVKETLCEVPRRSADEMERIEEEIDARIMRKVLQERQCYILQQPSEELVQCSQAAPHPTTDQPSEHFLPPTWTSHHSKVIDAAVDTDHSPGAVRVAGINSRTPAEEDSLACNEEIPCMDQSDMTPYMQTPQPTVPDYFHEHLMLEATLVTESDRHFRYRRRTSGGTESRLFVEARPLDDQPKELQCIDVLKSKKVCTRIVLAALLCVGILVAILVPLILKGQSKQEGQSQGTQTAPPLLGPFQTDLKDYTIDALRDPWSAQSRANTWILSDPAFDMYSNATQLQRFALAVMFYEMGGQGWTRNDSWLDYETNECKWYMAHEGDPCNEDGFLEILNLTSNYLVGTVPPELHYLDGVKILDLSNNNLWGNAPTFSHAASVVEIADLSNNSFSGYMTADIGFVNPNLRIMRNSYNQFEGKILALFGLAPNVVEFESRGNRYIGTIPAAIGTLDKMERLVLGYNNLEGRIPSEIGSMSLLRVFDVSGNKISGTIPSSLGFMLSLQLVDIRNTSLAGDVPEALCELHARGQLALYVDCDGALRCCF